MRTVADYLATDPQPCTSGSQGEAEDYKIVVLPQCTNPVVSLGADTTMCAGSILTLDAGNAGLTYLWSNQETTQTIAVNAAGAYSVTVTDGACSTTDTVQVTVTPNPSVTGTANPAIICPGETTTLTATGADSYVWENGPTTTTWDVNPTQTTSYTVTGTANGCSSSASVSVIVKDSVDCENAVKDVQAIELNVYPNPANATVTVSGNQLASHFNTYTIVDLTGRVLSTERVMTDNLSIDVSKLVNGVYFVNFNGSLRGTVKIEVKH